MKQAIIVDIDGTIATHYDADGNQLREHHDNSQLHVDLPIPEIIELVQMYDDIGYSILIVTGRMGNDTSRNLTEEWLRRHLLQYDHLFMRANKDFRPDAEVKQDIYKQFIEPYFEIRLVLDDRQRVVDMWRANGLRCLQVDVGDF